MMTVNEAVPKFQLVNSSDEDGNVLEEPPFIQPKFGEFQLLGDGLLVRFADQILGQHPSTIHGTRMVGYCVNGQRIDQLRQRIKSKSYPLGPKLLVLIGTADVLGGSNIYTMTKRFNALLTLLKRSMEKLLILTLPPVPKLCVTYYHWNLIRQYNNFLKSLDNGTDIIVADICPLFTKFRGALEYDVNVNLESRCEPVHYFKKRKSLSLRRKSLIDEKKLEGKGRLSDYSESDYRNTTDTNTSIDSEIFSSEMSQETENSRSSDLHENKQVQSITRKTSERVQSPVRFVVRTLQSVFGKDMLNRKKAQSEDKSKTPPARQQEERVRRSPFDLNENLCAWDSWTVESEEDSMSEIVYYSQEEIEYDVVDLEGGTKKSEIGEFSKFVESLNESDENNKRRFHLKRCKRDCFRNERPERTESSSSSNSSTPNKQLCSFIDNNFRYFLEKSTQASGEIDSSMDSGFGSCYSPGNLSQLNSSRDFLPGLNSSKLDSHVYKRKSSRRLFSESRGYKNADGMSEKDKMIYHLASKVCYLEFYELFYRSGKKRTNMVHLNYDGLVELKNFLVSNNYVTI